MLMIVPFSLLCIGRTFPWDLSPVCSCPCVEMHNAKI